MTSSPERLSAADASNVVMDAPDQVNGFLLAGLLGPGGFVGPDGTADLDLLRSVVAGRIQDTTDVGLRRFSQRIARDGRRLVWQDCAPELSWHVRLVEPVAGRDGLAAVCAGLMTTPLVPDRPLWELLIVPGAAPHGPGIIVRIHHAVADGVAGARLIRDLFDAPGADDPAFLRAPATVPGPTGPAQPPLHAHRSARRADRRPLWRSLAGSMIRLTALFRTPVPRTILLGPIGPHRGVAFAEVDLAELAAGAKIAGGTVNDALLAAVVAATATTLRTAGESVPPTLPVSVPVALPDRGTSGNAVGVMLVSLPTAEADVVARIGAISRLTRAGKGEARAQGTLEITRSRWGARAFAAIARHQRLVALFVTNVRGPERPLRLAGAPLERAWPVSAIQGNVRLGIAAFSYAGRLGVAAHLDADALDCDGIGRRLDEELARIAALGRTRPSLGG